MAEITYSRFRRNVVTESTNLGLNSTMFVNNNNENPTSVYLLKTGDNATGNYSFDSTTLIIDSTNHRAGFGTNAPHSTVEIYANSASMLMLNRQSTTYEGGLSFADNGVVKWWMFQNEGGNDLQIQLSGVAGESDTYPRLKLYGSTKDVYLACSGGYSYFGSHLGSSSFVSGFAGSGWKLDTTSDVSLTVDNLYVRKSMYVYELVINKIRCTNGSLWVSDACKIDHVIGSTAYIDTDGGNMTVPFVVNDVIRCQHWTGRGIKYYSATVNSVDASGVYFTFTVIDGAGTPTAGDEVVRIGNSSNTNRQGALYLTASDSNAPYMDILDGVTGYSFSGKTRVRLGKLDGITDAYYGALSGYGLYTSSAYITGCIVATTGLIGGWTINSTYLAKDTGTGSTSVGLAPNDYPFFAGATYANRATAKFWVKPTGELWCTKATIKTETTGRRVELLAADHSLNFYSDDNSAIQLDSSTIPSLFIRDSSNTNQMVATYSSLDINNTGSTSRFYIATGSGTLTVTMQASSYVTMHIDLPSGTQSGEVGPNWKAVYVNINTGRIVRAD